MINIDELTKLIEEYLLTLDDESDYWDGVCMSDREMAKRFLLDKKGLINFIKEPVIT